MAKANKKKIKMEFICKSCGYKPEPKTTGNWECVSTTCPKCGGKVGINFEEEQATK